MSKAIMAWEKWKNELSERLCLLAVLHSPTQHTNTDSFIWGTYVKLQPISKQDIRVLENVGKQTRCVKRKLSISVRNMAHNFEKQILGSYQKHKYCQLVCR